MTAHRSLHEVTLNLPSVSPHQRGFTLIELIMVIFMLGVLAMFAAPRIFYSNDFNTHGFHDETLSLLRYAQKAAIAQRRMVCVTFDTASALHNVSLTMENPTLTTTPIICNVNLTGPKGESPAKITAKTRVTYSSASNLIFNGLGQPVDSLRKTLTANTTVQVANGGTAIAQSIAIESDTGYVHD